jgi:hypothetical protein
MRRREFITLLQRRVLHAILASGFAERAVMRKALFYALTFVVLAIPLSRGGFTQSNDGASAALPSDGMPAWAFLWDPTVKVPPPDDTPNPLPGSTAAFSWKQTRDLFFAPDWHPDDHPAMPEIVANGGSPMFALADRVIASRAQVVRRMQILPGCPSITSSSR